MNARIMYCRTGVSLVEVIFSIGVILIGLLGVMSILPLAGNRAQDSVSLSVGSAIADGFFQRLKSERYLSTRRFVAVDEVDPSFAPPNDTFRTLFLPPHLAVPEQQSCTNPLQPFCIDPLFVSGSGYFFPGPAQALNRIQFGSYSVRFFPFYTLNHDPTTDPSAPQSTMITTPPNFSRLPMRRVGITRTSGGVFLDKEQAFQLTESIDDLNFLRTSDRSQSGFIRGTPAVVDENAFTANWQRYGSRVPTGEFTWIATVVPQPGNRFASVSVVVIRKRQRALLVPDRVAVNPQGNATDERLAYVSFASGFVGGAGGSVDLVSSDTTVSRLTSGDWLMLSGDFSTGTVHRWYRVAALDGEPEELLETPARLGLNASSPTVPRPIWRRRVYLDGPDFPFPSGPQTRTFATLVEGVVSVSEHVVRLQDF